MITQVCSKYHISRNYFGIRLQVQNQASGNSTAAATTTETALNTPVAGSTTRRNSSATATYDEHHHNIDNSTDVAHTNAITVNLRVQLE
jgi:Flp pilus assembly protein TadG